MPASLFLFFFLSSLNRFRKLIVIPYAQEIKCFLLVFVRFHVFLPIVQSEHLCFQQFHVLFFILSKLFREKFRVFFLCFVRYDRITYHRLFIVAFKQSFYYTKSKYIHYSLLLFLIIFTYSFSHINYLTISAVQN